MHPLLPVLVALTASKEQFHHQEMWYKMCKSHCCMQVRRLMAERQAAGWSFSTLFMAKDSLARMYEAAHMLDDALREYSELEACYLEAMAAGSELASAAFGAMHGYIAGPRPYKRADLVREPGFHAASILRAVEGIRRDAAVRKYGPQACWISEPNTNSQCCT